MKQTPVDLLIYVVTAFVIFLVLGTLVALFTELEFRDLFSFQGLLVLAGLSVGAAFVATLSPASELQESAPAERAPAAKRVSMPPPDEKPEYQIDLSKLADAVADAKPSEEEAAARAAAFAMQRYFDVPYPVQVRVLQDSDGRAIGLTFPKPPTELVLEGFAFVPGYRMVPGPVVGQATKRLFVDAAHRLGFDGASREVLDQYSWDKSETDANEWRVYAQRPDADDAETAEAATERRGLLYQNLLDLIDQAEDWGRKQNWPAHENYPQHEEIRTIVKELADDGGLEELEKFHLLYEKLKGAELANWARWFFQGIGGWMN